MNRSLLLLGWISTLCFAAPVAADDVALVELIPLAELPVYIQPSSGVMTAWRNHAADSENRPRRAGRIGHVMISEQRYEPISEYRVVSEWVASNNDHSAPEYFDLVAVVENRGAVPVGPIYLELYLDRKVGETGRTACESPHEPQPETQATWQGSLRIDTNMIDSLEGKTAIGLKFGAIRIWEHLLDDLRARDMWPWEVKFEVMVRCAECSPDSVSILIPMGMVC